jgi:lipopolysaccharide biosynthesis glycosyltransferase
MTEDDVSHHRRILGSPPIECGEATDFEVHILTCHRDLLDAIWCLKTFCHFSNTRPAIVIHDDGTLGASDVETLLQHFHGCRIIRRADADAELTEFLSAYPHCLRFRLRPVFYCALKLFDAFHLARADKLLLLDSDLLFFRRPVELLKHIAADRPCFQRDYQDAYSMPRAALETTFGMAIEPMVNAGLMFLQRRHYSDNLDLIERYLGTATSDPARDVNRHEQTLHAMLLSKYGAKPLGDGYQISNQAPITDRTVAHHSVRDGSRAEMQAEGQRRLRATGFLGALERNDVERRATLDSRPPIIIAAACDRKFAPPLTVMLKSLLANSAGARRFIVFVLSDGLSPAVRTTIQRSLLDRRAEVRFVEIDQSSLQSLKLSHHASPAVYSRLLVHTAVPEEIDRLIYLDSDLIVNGDLQVLWDMDLHGKTLLAVQEQCRDSQTLSGSKALPNYLALGLPPDAKYFNSGVMLIDLKKWRDTDVSGRALAYLHAYRDKVLWWDQDALNAILASDWGELDHRWNVLTQTFTNPHWNDGPVKDRAAYEAMVRHPYILHFNTGSKPWDKGNQHPRRDLFLHYLSLTRWAGSWPSPA